MIFESFILYDLIRNINDHPLDAMMDGKMSVYKWPEKGHLYVIGVDTSGGDIHGDFSYAFVMDVDTCEQEASLHARFLDYVLAQKIVIIARFYNNAMLVIERNNHRYSVINSVVHAEGYDNLYYAEDEKVGWLTSSNTKPLIITGSDGLAPAIHKRYLPIQEEKDAYLMSTSQGLK